MEGVHTCHNGCILYHDIIQRRIQIDAMTFESKVKVKYFKNLFVLLQVQTPFTILTEEFHIF